MSNSHAISILVGAVLLFMMYLGLSGQFSDLEDLVAHGNTLIISHQSETYSACFDEDIR